jgi:hypothetical protein
MSRTTSPNPLSDDDIKVVCEIIDSLAFGLLGEGIIHLNSLYTLFPKKNWSNS